MKIYTTKAMNKDNSVDIDLLSKVDKDRAPLNLASLVDILLIAIILICLSSKFITSTGFTIALNADDTDLPVSISSDEKGVLTHSELTILHIQSENMILFDGSIFNKNSLATYLGNKSDLSQQVLLIKANKNCNLQSFLNICEIAQSAGFKAVQIASVGGN